METRIPNPDQKSKSERKKRAPEQKSKSERKKRAPDQKSKRKRKRKNPKRKRKHVVHRDPVGLSLVRLVERVEVI
jgi:hypothetical protein